MLSIGFSTQFYTLWDVTHEVRYSNTSEGPVPYGHTQYTYLQNLSTDEGKALEKAKEMGVKDLTVDTDLYGRSGSWNFEKKLFSKLPNSISPFFEFGKYSDGKIDECADFKYLHWYQKETHNRYAKAILLANGYIEYMDYIYAPEEAAVVEKRKKNEKIVEELEAQGGKGTFIFTPQRNLNGNGNIVVDGLNVNFSEYKTMEYAGFEYSLPTIKGVGKKIKGLELVCEVSVQSFKDDYDGTVAKALVVLSFKINK